MHPIRFRQLLFLFPLLIGTPSQAYAATIYSLVDLGTLGGTSSFGTAINDAGTAVGYSTLVGGETRTFIFSQG